MDCSRRYSKVKANSLLESVLALSIVSACLYVAIMVYASVFSPATSARAYASQNKINEAFYLMQIGSDSLTSRYGSEPWRVEEESEGGLRRITVHYQDSVQAYAPKTFFINAE